MPASVTRITLLGSLAGEDSQNTFWYECANFDVAASLLLAPAVASIMATHFEFAWSTQFTLSAALVNIWEADPAYIPTPSLPVSFTPIVGDANGELNVQGTSLLLNFKAFTLPPNRKRLFVGGFTEDTNTATGIPSSALLAAGVAAVDELLEDITVGGQDFEFAVVRLSADGRYLDSNALTAGTVSNRWAGLRSRIVR